MEKTELFDAADRFTELKEEKARKEAEVKAINKELAMQEMKLMDLMVECKLNDFKGNNGIRYLMNNKVYANVKGENKPRLIEVLKKNGWDGLVKEEVNTNTLSSTIREQGWEEECQLPEFLQGLVSLYVKTTIGTRRS